VFEADGLAGFAFGRFYGEEFVFGVLPSAPESVGVACCMSFGIPL